MQGYKKSCVCVPSQSMAVKIVERILKVSTEISEPAQVETLLDFVKPLIADIPGVEVDEEVCLHMLKQLIHCATNFAQSQATSLLVPYVLARYEDDEEHKSACRTFRKNRILWQDSSTG